MKKLQRAAWGVSDTALAALDQRRACEQKIAAPPPPPPPVKIEAPPPADAGAEEALARSGGDDFGSDGLEAEVTPELTCKEAPKSEASVAAIRAALALPVAERAEVARGWACDPVQLQRAKALAKEAGAAVRAGAPASDGLTSAEARRALCELPWPDVLRPDSLDKLFDCPPCPSGG